MKITKFFAAWLVVLMMVLSSVSPALVPATYAVEPGCLEGYIWEPNIVYEQVCTNEILAPTGTLLPEQANACNPGNGGTLYEGQCWTNFALETQCVEYEQIAVDNGECVVDESYQEEEDNQCEEGEIWQPDTEEICTPYLVSGVTFGIIKRPAVCTILGLTWFEGFCYIGGLIGQTCEINELETGECVADEEYEAELSAPELISPLDDSFVKGDSLTNSWSEVAGATGYVYESYHNADATDLRWHQEVLAPDTSKTAINVANAIFWWRVKAVNIDDESDWSELWKVTIDNDAPVSSISSPLEDSVHTSTINIIGNTVDNNNVLLTTLEYASYESESCGEFSVIEILGNEGNSASFDWNIAWTPAEYGSYCIKAYGVDSAGNLEASAIVKNVVYQQEEQDDDGEDEEDNNQETPSGQGGGGGGGFLPSLFIHTQAAQTSDNNLLSVLITWFTNNPANSRVVYDTSSHSNPGEAPNYGYQWSTGTFNNDPKVTFHSVLIEGLQSGTTYFFRPISAASPEVYGTEISFTVESAIIEEQQESEQGDGGESDQSSEGVVAGVEFEGQQAPDGSQGVSQARSGESEGVVAGVEFEEDLSDNQDDENTFMVVGESLDETTEGEQSKGMNWIILLWIIVLLLITFGAYYYTVARKKKS